MEIVVDVSTIWRHKGVTANGPTEKELKMTNMENNIEMQATSFFQTKLRGTNDQEYQIYLSCADDGKGNEFMTGRPLKTYDEWLGA